jgi:P4 family phage/plasmid primase-like protien
MTASYYPQDDTPPGVTPSRWKEMKLEQARRNGDTGPDLHVVPDPVEYSRSDLGNAEMLAAEHGERFRFVRAGRAWLVWKQGRWREDETGEVMRAAKETVRDRLVQAASIEDDDKRKREGQWALNSHSDQRLRAMVSLASTEPGIVLAATELDTDPYLLACGNGVVDLRTGKLRAPDPADLISLGTDVAFDPNATCPRWLKFLREIFDSNQETITFMRRGCGYTLSGDTREQVRFVLHGGGWNGKSVFIATMRGIVGSFAAVTPFDAFARVRDRGIRNDLARLHRSRLVVASESGEGRKLDEATVKLVTGGDMIPCRVLHQEFFEYLPGFKIFLVTNHRPRVEGDDEAIWRQLRLVPFNVSFKGREDDQLTEKLRGELPGILNWAVQGYLEWQEHEHVYDDQFAVTSQFGDLSASLNGSVDAFPTGRRRDEPDHQKRRPRAIPAVQQDIAVLLVLREREIHGHQFGHKSSCRVSAKTRQRAASLDRPKWRVAASSCTPGSA